MDIHPHDMYRLQVVSLRHQAELKRINTSEAIQCIMDYIKEHEETDHAVNPEFHKDKKQNPWIAEKKCVIQ